jgi:CRISPR-associated endonuclease/helicase Cas3
LPVGTNPIFPIGWDIKSSKPVDVLSAPEPASPLDANDADRLSQSDWQSIAQHSDRVCRELDVILAGPNVGEADLLKLAARWHDRGKAHAVFQDAIDDGQDGQRLRPSSWQNSRFVGKAPGRNKTTGDPGWWHRYKRKHFRHELASALAVLMAGDDQIATNARDLVAYLVAAHHGKVRLSIRSLPEETIPDSNRRFARGVWDDDTLPATGLGNNVLAPAVTLSLEPMELGQSEDGQPSWAERMLRLRDTLGPFHLAYLEAILRAADARASRDNKPPEVSHA